MKLSELIQAAQEAIRVHGDIELVTDDGWSARGLTCKAVTEHESVDWDFNQGEVIARIKTFE